MILCFLHLILESNEKRKEEIKETSVRREVEKIRRMKKLERLSAEEEKPDKTVNGILCIT